MTSLQKTTLRLRSIAKKIATPLLNRSLPEPLRGVETMLSREELSMLFALGAEHWDGRGLIVDAGCFLGGSTLALGEGLKTNPKWRNAPVSPVIHSYDLFQVEAYTTGTFFKTDAVIGSSFLPRYQQNIKNVSDLVTVHVGDITAQPWSGEKIEVLFIDVAKHWTVNDFLVQQFFPSLIPGHSIVVQQDYLYGAWNGWIAVTMEYFSDYFTQMDRAKKSSVMFKLTKEFEPDLFERPLFQSLTIAQITELMDRAIGRFSGTERATMLQSRQQLMTLLAEQAWSTHPSPRTGS